VDSVDRHAALPDRSRNWWRHACDGGAYLGLFSAEPPWNSDHAHVLRKHAWRFFWWSNRLATPAGVALEKYLPCVSDPPIGARSVLAALSAGIAAFPAGASSRHAVNGRNTA